MNAHVLTFDIDWVSDWAIRRVANLLEDAGVKATWFVTHDSPQIRELRKRSRNFEIGIHPNLLPGSSQGKTEEEIFETLLKIVPEAKVVRTHGLVFSNALMKRLTLKYSLDVDSSVLLFESANIEPHIRYYKETRRQFVRIPYFWEDSIEILKQFVTFDFTDPKYHVPGLKVYDFHPIHVVLNTNEIHSYNWVKSNVGVGKVDEKSIASIRNDHLGAETMLKQVIKYIKETQGKSYTLSEIARAWLERRELP